MSKDSTAAKDSKSSTTTGNAATSATAAPPAEQRTQIASVIRSEQIQETTNVNFTIAVGATVPASVRFHPLPPRIVRSIRSGAATSSSWSAAVTSSFGLGPTRSSTSSRANG